MTPEQLQAEVKSVLDLRITPITEKQIPEYEALSRIMIIIRAQQALLVEARDALSNNCCMQQDGLHCDALSNLLCKLKAATGAV